MCNILTFDCCLFLQEEVYEQTAKIVIPSVVNGYNATVFAYGATGAGKTHTMVGTGQEPGIMARTLNDIFLEMDRTSEDMKYKVMMSYLEVVQTFICIMSSKLFKHNFNCMIIHRCILYICIRKFSPCCSARDPVFESQSIISHSQSVSFRDILVFQKY